ncbi:MAG: phosphoribosylformylglycinamidine synthase I [Deltaproteobacteria bacterium CG07_land_8_20_14_0_80_38_7]|nr:MAG: phosphoribosylformylglycinamidine synthase I [Deltaproteobacteria bacterium CG07_land_8_20_14_0_80_38_7]
MKFGIIVFPGSNCDDDCRYVMTELMQQDSFFLWHKTEDLNGADCLILPGGFSYGDYLRCGAMAANSPIMKTVKSFADNGGIVIGICNGFQILQEASLLPGTLIRNKNLKFICKNIHIRVESNNTPFTNTCRGSEVLKMPIAHMDGNFFVDKKQLQKLEESGQVLLKYCNEDGEPNEEFCPNGAVGNVAGVTNLEGNVCGLMPHPERCSEKILGNQDGLKIFGSIVSYLNTKNR